MSEPCCVQVDSFLTLHYRVSLNASKPVARQDVVNTFDDKPATLQLGIGQLAPALEEKLLGLKTGDRAIFELASGTAFGSRNSQLIQTISRSLLDAESEAGEQYQLGDVIEFNAPQGRCAGVLKQLDQTHAVVDFNHPLAGQPVCFEVQIIGVL